MVLPFLCIFQTEIILLEGYLRAKTCRYNHQSRVKPTMPGTSNLIFLGVGQWGQFFIVDKRYKNMLNVGYRSVSHDLPLRRSTHS